MVVPLDLLHHTPQWPLNKGEGGLFLRRSVSWGALHHRVGDRSRDNHIALGVYLLLKVLDIMLVHGWALSIEERLGVIDIPAIKDASNSGRLEHGDVLILGSLGSVWELAQGGVLPITYTIGFINRVGINVVIEGSAHYQIALVLQGAGKGVVLRLPHLAASPISHLHTNPGISSPSLDINRIGHIGIGSLGEEFLAVLLHLIHCSAKGLRTGIGALESAKFLKVRNSLLEVLRVKVRGLDIVPHLLELLGRIEEPITRLSNDLRVALKGVADASHLLHARKVKPNLGCTPRLASRALGWE
jgi:hypothetical protein